MVHDTPCVVVILFTRVTVSVGVNKETDDMVHAVCGGLTIHSSNCVSRC
jgi:hypothetical protein